MPASRGSHRRHRARSVWSTSAESGRPYFLSTFVREAGLVDFGDAAQGADIRPDVLSGGLVVLHVAGEEYAAERQDFVLFGKPVQPFVNAHGLIVALHPSNSLDQHCHHQSVPDNAPFGNWSDSALAGPKSSGRLQPRAVHRGITRVTRPSHPAPPLCRLDLRPYPIAQPLRGGVERARPFAAVEDLARGVEDRARSRWPSRCAWIPRFWPTRPGAAGSPGIDAPGGRGDSRAG